MFAKAQRSDQPSNTGAKAPPARRAGPEPKPKKSVFDMTDAEYRKLRRELKIVS